MQPLTDEEVRDLGKKANKIRETIIEMLLAAGWPTRYGGAGLGVAEESILVEKCVVAGLPWTPHPDDAFGFGLLGPTLLRWVDDAPKEEKKSAGGGGEDMY